MKRNVKYTNNRTSGDSGCLSSSLNHKCTKLASNVRITSAVPIFAQKEMTPTFLDMDFTNTTPFLETIHFTKKDKF